MFFYKTSGRLLLPNKTKTKMAATSTVNITISFLAGNRENISHSIASENGEISYPGLLRSIGFVQEKCNQVLTKVIEDEKSKRANLKLGLKDSSPSGIPTSYMLLDFFKF